MTYLITFSCYGKRLHGAESGAVDKRHKMPGGPLAGPSQAYLAAFKTAMKDSVHRPDRISRAEVLLAIREICELRGWLLMAAHLRTDHLHLVIDAMATPERVMRDVKSRASWRLSRIEPERKRYWARHGSTRYLWTPKAIASAVSYVVSGQGEPMAVYYR